MYNVQFAKKPINYGGRGSALEEILKWANIQYSGKNIAKIDKIPVPVKILNIITTKLGTKITDGYIESKSTVDYVGCIKGGRFICFDAKETQEDAFPLKNIHQHQMDYMKQIHNMGGRSFLIVYFAKYGKYYRWEYPSIEVHWNNWNTFKGKRGYASVKYDVFLKETIEVVPKNQIAIDYLEGYVLEY